MRIARMQSYFLYFLILVFLGLAFWWARRETKTGNLADKEGEFDLLRGAELLERRSGNDGDSFAIGHSGQILRFRLYFVDTPETSDRFPQRVGYQARYFGIDRKDVIEVGREAREFTLDLLREEPFEILTKWEQVMKSDRLHAMIRFPQQKGEPWLSEILVRRGLARIYTLPVDLPDGTTKREFKAHLKDLEAEARRKKRGAWRYR
ncbi:MAG: thermonuclease family protein [Verrucomicrobiota bacterium]